MPYRRTLDHVFDTVKYAKETNRGVSLLIGAGCSVTAGIPLASGFVNEIERRFPTKYARAAEPRTYARCMAELTRAERRSVIADFVDPANKINWPHLCIALLIQHGYVDRVLTTNFDPLVVRACALLNEFPAVYDFAASQYFRAADIPGRAIFYLHGQRGGFVLLNTARECEEHSARMQPVFADAGSGRVWIVVGYSGENDPVFDHLASVPYFDDGLYWVGYKDNPPGKDVRQQLLEKGKDAYFVPGYDADSFFGDLCRKLGIFPPSFLSRPFTYLDTSFGYIADYSLSKHEATGDLCRGAKDLIAKAISQLEPNGEGTASHSDPEIAATCGLVEAEQLLLSGEYKKVIALDKERPAGMPDRLAHLVAWSYFLLGNALSDQAEQKKGEEADRLWTEAGEKYARALATKADMHEALYNWGTALQAHAEHKKGEEAVRLLAQAEAKYAQALGIQPDMYEALYNWGRVLSVRAKQTQGQESDQLLAEAQGKYQQALTIKPDLHQALNNLSEALLRRATLVQGEDAESLLLEAQQRGEQAESLHPGAGAYNLACIRALLGDEAGCRRWIEKTRDFGALPSRAHMAQDTDLDSVRDTDWFQEILAAAPE